MDLVKQCFVSLLLFVTVSCAQAAEPDTLRQLQESFRQADVAFALQDLQTGGSLRYNEPRCQEAFSPFATFHLPLALIALETGAAKNAQTLIPWNRLKYPTHDEAGNELPQHWTQDQTLRAAFEHGVPWYFQELAQRSGPRRLQRQLDKLHYGNHVLAINATGELEQFWVEGSLRITLNEQLAFLQALHDQQLPVSKRAQKLVTELLIKEQTEFYTLRGIAGGGMLSSGKYLGWFVGWLETNQGVCVFALNLLGADNEAVNEPTVKLAKTALSLLGYLPKTAAGND
jgi:beta-lactamase class D